MSKCTVKTFCGVENWLIVIYVLCYKFWFSRPASNVLSPVSNWVKWVEWVTQGQELKISLWNWLHWIQCLQIGLRDIISYFYYQMLFLKAILLSTLSKMSNYMVKTSIFSWGPILLDSAPLNYVKMSKWYKQFFLSIASKFLFTSNISAAYSLPFSRILILKYNVLKYQGISSWSLDTWVRCT